MNKNPGLFKLKKLLYTGTLFTFTFCLLTLLSSCNETFEPFTENDEAAFSIFGFLDASADTQWVRITPLRDQISQPTFKPEMTVTLQNLESGETFAMNDSLVLFPDGFHILNAWTPINIEPNQTYILKAEQPDGKQSRVTVSTPEDFPEPQLVYLDGAECDALLIIKDIERLADVIYRWYVQVNTPGIVYRRFLSVPFRSRIQQVSSSEHRVRVDFRRARRLAGRQLILPANTTVQILDRHILVAAGGPEWV